MPCAADRALQRYASRAVPGSLGQLKILASGISHGSLAANSLRNLLDQLPAESSPAALRAHFRLAEDAFHVEEDAHLSDPGIIVEDIMHDMGKRMGFQRSEEHTSELQSLMRISYAVFCLKKKKQETTHMNHITPYHNIHSTNT